jgi:hypothetical protein
MTKTAGSDKRARLAQETVAALLKAGFTFLEIRSVLGLDIRQMDAAIRKASAKGVCLTQHDYVTVSATSLPEAYIDAFGATKDAVFRLDKPDGNGMGTLSIVDLEELKAKMFPNEIPEWLNGKGKQTSVNDHDLQPERPVNQKENKVCTTN